MLDKEKFERSKEIANAKYKDYIEKLSEAKKQLLESQKNGDYKKVEFYMKRIDSILKTIDYYNGILSSMRLGSEQDLAERRKIMANFPRLVSEVIADDNPIVFHGNNNIKVVEEIIKSGGLFTPEQRGVDFKSFATLIDVTSKSNISVSCEFADNNNPFLPYGAIFAFYPKRDEFEKVLNTNGGTEVYGGVDGINFKNESSRLVGIITTNENLESLKRLCVDNGIGAEKVFNHEQFIEFCRNMSFLGSYKNLC